jgi:hypothetical protein
MKSILEEAIEVVNHRQSNYGERENNFQTIANFWSIILSTEVSPEQVALCMIALKIAREMFKSSRDNAVDIAGYADCLAEINGHQA